MSDEPEAEEAEQRDDEVAETAGDADAEAEAESDEGEPEEATEGFQNGDFVELEYTIRTIEDGTLVDTTDHDLAVEEGIDDEERTYEPRTLVLGEGFVFDAVEGELLGGEVGRTGTVEIPAADAFGEYDEEEVRTVSADKIDEDDRFPGAQVHVDGEHGQLETIIGGRARVNFNHPLAGEDIEYEYEVVGEVDDPLERAESLFELFLDLELEMWLETDAVEEERLVQSGEDEETEAGDEGVESEEAEGGDEADAEEDETEEPPEPETETVETEKETLYVEADPQLTMNQQWMFQKQQICQQVMELIDVDRVVIQEIIDGSPGMGGMMGGMMGGGGGLEEALEEGDVDAEELVEEIEGTE